MNNTELEWGMVVCLAALFGLAVFLGWCLRSICAVRDRECFDPTHPEQGCHGPGPDIDADRPAR